MKKSTQLLALLLVLVLLLMGCGPAVPDATDGTDGTEGTNGGSVDDPTGGAETNVFRVGFGRADITPTESVPLAGYGNTERRMSEGFLNYLYTSVIAVTDEADNTVILIANDLIHPYGAYAPDARQSVSDATGVPYDQVIINCSHTHSAPDVSNTTVSSIPRYNTYIIGQITKAAVAAMEDRKPAEMYVGSGETEKHNFVRRYQMVDGSWAGDNFGDWTLEILGHETEADREMRVIQFKREGGKDVVLVSWQTHPHLTGGSAVTTASSDIIGELRETLEAEADCYSAYFQGGAGNINTHSAWAQDNAPKARDWRAVGQSLAGTAADILKNATKVETGLIETSVVNYTGTVNHEEDHLMTVALEIQRVWTSTGDSAKCKEMGAPYGIVSPYHANYIIQRARLPETQDVEISAVAFGDVAFTFAPYEMFDTSAKYIRDNSPYEMTFALGYSNSAVGYMPTYDAFPHGGYEVQACRFIRGTGEILADEFVAMLEALHS